MIRKTENIWFSPYNIHYHIQEAKKLVGGEKFAKDRKWKRAREAHVAMIVALGFYRLEKKPAYIQLPKKDPPDAIMMWESQEKKGEYTMLDLEITSYKSGQETFLEQLKRGKAPEKHIFSSDTSIVFQIQDYEGIDVQNVIDYLSEIDAPFAIWLILKKQIHPDTIVEFTSIDKYGSKKISLNIGEALKLFIGEKHSPILHMERVGNINKVGKSKLPFTHQKPPWET